jgi:hypothetical protein
VLALEGQLPREHGPAILQFILNVSHSDVQLASLTEPELASTLFNADNLQRDWGH